MDISPRYEYEIEHDRRDVGFYWGVAAGSTHAALRRAYEDDDIPTPERLMLNHTTVNNQVWAGPEWFIDCGGAPDTIRANGGHKTSLDEYVAYLRDPPVKYGDDPGDVSIDRFALRDWPCEPDVRDALDASVDDLQQRTLDDHIRMMDAVEGDGRVDGEPVAVLQGWEPGEYLDHLDLLRDHGLVTDTIGLGSVCRRGGPDEGGTLDHIKDVAHRVRRNLPPRVDLHGFGLKRTMLEEPEALTVFDSVDSAAWENAARYATKDGHEIAPPIDGAEYGDWRDWDGRGNPRYTWGNVQQCYLGYHEHVSNVTRNGQTDMGEWGEGVRVTSLADWPAVMDDLSARGDESDGYALLKCVCGTVVDPGRPDAVPEPGCRHCERTDINLWDKRLAAREARFA